MITKNTVHCRIMFVPLTLVLTVGLFAQDHKSPHWSYDGDQRPNHWADLNPEFALCKSGHHQSPIDISNQHNADPPAMRVDFKSVPQDSKDNCHKIMINYS